MQTSPKKIKVAIVKFGGLSAGGTEKFLQTIAANLDHNRFEVDYYYCDSAPYIGSDFVHPDTSVERERYLREHGVNMIKFHVGAKDLYTRTHVWRDTDFWDVFDERNYDIIQTGRAGHPEYPFTHIKQTPIVDSLHLLAGVDNQYNIARVMHISKWSAERWIARGGDKSRVVLVSHPMEIHAEKAVSLRSELGLGNDVVVFGLHQRAADTIFSPIPLEAYRAIESPQTHYVMLGGGEAYRRQARALGITNITFLEHCADPIRIYSFLKTLDVYAHGRKDGEVNSTAMAEAMYFGLPIVSHTTPFNNGHVECIGEAGRVVDGLGEYQTELERLMKDTAYRAERSQAAVQRFSELYELRGQIEHIETIYESVVTDPYPHRWARIWARLHWSQHIRELARWGLARWKKLTHATM